MKEPKTIVSGAIWAAIIVAVSSAAFFLSLVAPLPLRQWGGLVVITTISSLLILRSATDIFNPQIAKDLLPYAVATFLVLSIGLFLLPSNVANIAGVVLFSIDAVAMFYWLVAIIVSSAKTLPRIGRK